MSDSNTIHIVEGDAACEIVLSHAVAKFVLRWLYLSRQRDRNENGSEDVWHDGEFERLVVSFNPVSDYTDAFLVVEHFTKQKIGFTLCYSAISERWTALISRMQKVADNTWVSKQEGQCESKSFGFAVCVAALRASGVNVAVESSEVFIEGDLGEPYHVVE